MTLLVASAFLVLHQYYFFVAISNLPAFQMQPMIMINIVFSALADHFIFKVEMSSVQVTGVIIIFAAIIQ